MMAAGISNRALMGYKASAPPSAVAPPAPPRKCHLPLSSRSARKMEKLCPAIAMTGASVSSQILSGTKQRANQTATPPLNISSSKVNMAIAGPAARKTFVVPVRPLPIMRTSCPVRNRTNSKPKGIAPRRYENTSTPKEILAILIIHLTFHRNDPFVRCKLLATPTDLIWRVMVYSLWIARSARASRFAGVPRLTARPSPPIPALAEQ